MIRQAEGAAALRVVRCTIGPETYFLDMSWIRSIQRIDRLRPYSAGPSVAASGEEWWRPAAVGWVEGAEGAVPVCSLAQLLNRPQPEHGGDNIRELSRILVLRAFTSLTRNKDILLALLVDNVSQVMQLARDQITALPPLIAQSPRNYFQAIIRESAGSMALLLSAELLLAAQEVAGGAGCEPGASRPVMAPPTAPPAERGTKAASSAGRIMIFSLPGARVGSAKLSLGLSVSQVCEILRPQPLVPVPLSPSWLTGFLNWRSRPIPVVDLQERLGMARGTAGPGSGQQRLVIARGPGREDLLGCLVQADIRAHKLPLPHSAWPEVLPFGQRFVKAVVKLEDELLLIPDIHHLVHTI